MSIIANINDPLLFYIIVYVSALVLQPWLVWSKNAALLKQKTEADGENVGKIFTMHENDLKQHLPHAHENNNIIIQISPHDVVIIKPYWFYPYPSRHDISIESNITGILYMQCLVKLLTFVGCRCCSLHPSPIYYWSTILGSSASLYILHY